MSAWAAWVLAGGSLVALVVIVSGVLDLFATTTTTRTAERRRLRDETAQYQAMRRALRAGRRRRWYVDVEEEA